MDPVQNPFSPGAGTPPPELAGRGELLEEARIMIGRTLNGRSTQGMLMTGLRGVGKTVILNELMRMAEEEGLLPLYVEATAESTLSKRRASLLAKGMIYSPRYGELAFTVPMFGNFMRRSRK